MNKPLHLVAAAVAIAALSGTAFAQATIKQSTISSWPHVIDQPGSYKLMGNLSVPAGMGGIRITAPNVTLDLNGFTIAGPVTCTWAATMTCSAPLSLAVVGIRAEAPGSLVRNGTIRGFAGHGFHGSVSTVVESLQVMHNAGMGVAIAGVVDASMTAGLVTDTTATLNGSNGFFVAGQIQRSIAKNNGASGFTGGTTSLTVLDSTSDHNKGYGVYNARARGVALAGNGVNRGAVSSMGGNLDGATPF